MLYAECPLPTHPYAQRKYPHKIKKLGDVGLWAIGPSCCFRREQRQVVPRFHQIKCNIIFYYNIF